MYVGLLAGSASNLLLYVLELSLLNDSTTSARFLTVSGVIEVLAANAESVDDPFLTSFTLDVLVELLEPQKLDLEVDGAEGLDVLEPQLEAAGAEGLDVLEPQLEAAGAEGLDVLEPQLELFELPELPKELFELPELPELGSAFSENAEVINIAATINIFVIFFICRQPCYIICKEMQEQ